MIYRISLFALFILPLLLIFSFIEGRWVDFEDPAVRDAKWEAWSVEEADLGEPSVGAEHLREQIAELEAMERRGEISRDERRAREMDLGVEAVREGAFFAATNASIAPPGAKMVSRSSSIVAVVPKMIASMLSVVCTWSSPQYTFFRLLKGCGTNSRGSGTRMRLSSCRA